MTETARIALLDDDPAILDSLSMFFAHSGYSPTVFADAEAFLLRMRSSEIDYDCVVSDVRMPGLSGLELVQHLARQPGSPPIILITGHGDISMAVSAVKQGAYDFFEKPFNEQKLLATVQQAIAETSSRRATERERAQMRELFEALPPRQKQVLELAAEGLTTKEIAQKIKISPRTVEGHRAWGMQKLKARNLADVVRIVHGATSA